MSFTPRTSNSGMSATTPYNNSYYVGGNYDGDTSNYYNYNTASTYQCTYYCIARLGEIAGEPVTTYSKFPSSPTHRIFPSRTGFGSANEWYGATDWEKSSDNTKPKLGAVVCYSKYPYDGGDGHVQIVEKIDGNTIYVSQNQNCYSGDFLTAINVADLITSSTKVFQGYIYNPYVSDEPSGKDVIELTNNSSYAYITFDGTRSDSAYDYKLQLVAPQYALVGNASTARDSEMGSDWEFVASINGSFFFPSSGGQYFANGIEKQHWTWNEQYDDEEYDNVLAIGGDGSNNTKLSSAIQGNMREFSGEWAITGGISLSGGSAISDDVDSTTGHAFIGYNGNKIIMGISKSGIAGSTLRNYIKGLGYTGVELDGGGSTSFMYNGTQYSDVYKGRSVKNVICLYKRKKDTKVYYTISLNAEPSEGGSVSGGGTYESGTRVTIKATPNKHYKFIGWSDGNTDMERTITASSNISLTAYFKKCGILISGSMGIDFQIL